jgi:hypothetical protein
MSIGTQDTGLGPDNDPPDGATSVRQAANGICPGNPQTQTAGARRRAEARVEKLAEWSLLTPDQVAERLQVSVAWVRDHSTRKFPRLPVLRVGGLLRYHPKDIDRWIADLRADGARKAS